MESCPAILAALEFWRQPALVKGWRENPLPNSMLDLIKIAAGCVETQASAAAATGRRPTEIQAAAVHFLHLVLVAPGASPQRALGLDGRVFRDEIVLHKRWLLKWLPPDRNPNWEAAAVLFKRVIDTSNSLLAKPRVSTGAVDANVSSRLAVDTAIQSAFRGFHDAPEAPPTQLRSRLLTSFLAAAALVLIAIFGVALVDIGGRFQNSWPNRLLSRRRMRRGLRDSPGKPGGGRAVDSPIRKLWQGDR